MEKTFKFLSPEEIDNIIINRIETCTPAKRPKKISNNSIKWTEYEKALRDEVILDLLGQGLSRRRTKEELMSRWNIKECSADKYINEATDRLIEHRDEQIDRNRDIMCEKLCALAETAIAAGDTKNALKAYDQLSKIYGLYNEKPTVALVQDIKFDFDK